jgi:NAD(P)H-flavin reductase
LAHNKGSGFAMCPIAAIGYRPKLSTPTEAIDPPSVEGSGDVVADFLHELDGWENAYPLSCFPEPDLKRAAEVLKANGMTLDAISASNMRHVVSCIAPKARAALTAMPATGIVTEAMEKAGRLAALNAGEPLDTGAVTAIFRAMIAAAPGSELKEEGGV